VTDPTTPATSATNPKDPKISNNRLAKEASAYLRQHMDNPVDWYPWGEEALSLAREQDKPILVSIGYSACHWCHVMAHESFEDSETAELMNRLYVNIKVDREERPDVDQIFMDTVTRLTGHGGWPLTIFLTPDGRPYYGGTYFPKEAAHNLPSFKQILAGVEHALRSRKGEVEQTAEQILSALAERPDGVAEAPPGPHCVVHGAREVMAVADARNGGFGGVPKFPTATNLEMLLAALDFLPAEEKVAALGHCAFTCSEMARRGLYDHLGGGFHRYCVDEDWTIPHFEKMLYDQGLLLRVYAETWRRLGCDESDDELLWPVRETVDYLRRQMVDPEVGAARGFYASEDADSEGEEGVFYVWRPEQIEDEIGDESAARFNEAYSVTLHGNFEHETTQLVDVAREPRENFREERERLRKKRAERIAPATDTKRVASWNGYAISGLARAGSLIGDDSMLRDATAAADFVLREMRTDAGRLLRIFNDGRASVPAFLDDHASMLEACLDLYRAGAGDHYLEAALRLAEDIAEHFFDASENDFFLTASDGEPLVHRPRSDHDGATPHAAGLATLGLLRVSGLCGADEWVDIATRVIRTHAFMLDKAPHAFPTLLRALALCDRGLSIAVIVGRPDDDARAALAARARRILQPDDGVVLAAPGAACPAGLDPQWLAGRDPEDGQATAYVCRGVTCSLPVTEPDQLEPLPSHTTQPLPND
jgi:uncharacterized protein YyaL (SSP411 family)